MLSITSGILNHVSVNKQIRSIAVNEFVFFITLLQMHVLYGWM